MGNRIGRAKKIETARTRGRIEMTRGIEGMDQSLVPEHATESNGTSERSKAWIEANRNTRQNRMKREIEGMDRSLVPEHAAESNGTSERSKAWIEAWYQSTRQNRTKSARASIDRNKEADHERHAHARFPLEFWTHESRSSDVVW
jgi:hypothetical protein